MNKWISVTLSIVLVLGLLAVTAACSLGEGGLRDTAEEGTVAADHDAAKIAQRVQTLAQNGFFVRYLISDAQEEDKSVSIALAVQGDKYYYDVDGAKGYLDLSDESVGRVYTQEDGAWVMQEIAYATTSKEQLKATPLSVLSYMGVYGAFASYKADKSVVSLVGRSCDRYVLNDSNLDASVSVEACIDRATDICLKWTVSGVTRQGAASASFACDQFCIGYTITLPTMAGEDPLNPSDPTSHHTIADDYDVSGLDATLTALIDSKLSIRWQSSSYEGDQVQDVTVLIDGKKLYYANGEEATYYDLSGSRGYLCYEEDGVWVKREISDRTPAALLSTLKTSLRSALDIMTSYADDAFAPATKYETTLAGRACDRYVIVTKTGSTTVHKDYYIDKETGLCLKSVLFTAIGTVAAGTATYECILFDTDCTITLPQ